MSYTFSKESFPYISGNGTLHFSALAQKIKKLHPEKTSYISGNRNLEKISYIFLKESLSYISGNGNPEKFFIFQETELSYNRETSYISGSNVPCSKSKKSSLLKNFLYFRR